MAETLFSKPINDDFFGYLGSGELSGIAYSGIPTTDYTITVPQNCWMIYKIINTKSTYARLHVGAAGNDTDPAIVECRTSSSGFTLPSIYGAFPVKKGQKVTLRGSTSFDSNCSYDLHFYVMA